MNENENLRVALGIFLKFGNNFDWGRKLKYTTIVLITRLYRAAVLGDIKSPEILKVAQPPPPPPPPPFVIRNKA